MILITGFAPYHEPKNASGRLIQSFIENLPDELSHLQSQLAFEIIECDISSRETEHQTLEANLKSLLSRYQPTVCIFTGQSPHCHKITLEKIGINSFIDEVIDAGRPVAYWSNLPGLVTLKETLESNGIPAEYSYYAGQRLCNHILHSSLYFSEQENLSHQSGFIHIPVLPEQVTELHHHASFMPLDMSRKALALVIQHVVKSIA